MQYLQLIKAIGGRLFKVAVTFIGKGSSAIGGRLFKIARAKLYYYQVGYRGLYKLSYYRSLALVKGEGKASRAYIGGAYANRAYVDKACADKAYIGGAYADGAYIGGAYIDGAAY